MVSLLCEIDQRFQRNTVGVLPTSVDNQTKTLKSAVVFFSVDGKFIQCDNGEIVEEIRWWLVGKLLMIYTCEDLLEKNKHDVGLILVYFMFPGSTGIKTIEVDRGVLQSILLTYTGEAFVRAIDWSSLDLEWSTFGTSDLVPLNDISFQKDPLIVLRKTFCVAIGFCLWVFVAVVLWSIGKRQDN